jgi:hypothetical protein
MRIEVALFELPDDPGVCGPRLLGRLTDPDLVEAVRTRVARARLRELAHLQGPVRLVPSPDETGAA